MRRVPELWDSTRTPLGFCYGLPWAAREALMPPRVRHPRPQHTYRPVGPVHCAAAYNVDDVKQLKSMVLLKPDLVGRRDYRGRTPLHVACEYGRESAVALLVSSHSEIDAYDFHKVTPLMTATQWSREKCAEILLRHRANTSLKDESGKTALHIAIYNDDVKMVTLLLQFKADIEQKTKRGFTPLLLAFHEYSTNVAKVLINKGANISVVDDYKRSTLMYAIRCGSPELFNLLIEKGIDFFHRDIFKWTALDYAIAGRCTFTNTVLAHHKQLCYGDQKQQFDHLAPFCPTGRNLSTHCQDGPSTSADTAAAMSKEGPGAETTVSTSQEGPRPRKYLRKSKEHPGPAPTTPRSKVPRSQENKNVKSMLMDYDYLFHMKSPRNITTKWSRYSSAREDSTALMCRGRQIKLGCPRQAHRSKLAMEISKPVPKASPKRKRVMTAKTESRRKCSSSKPETVKKRSELQEATATKAMKTDSPKKSRKHTHLPPGKTHLPSRSKHSEAYHTQLTQPLCGLHMTQNVHAQLQSKIISPMTLPEGQRIKNPAKKEDADLSTESLKAKEDLDRFRNNLKKILAGHNSSMSMGDSQRLESSVMEQGEESCKEPPRSKPAAEKTDSLLKQASAVKAKRLSAKTTIKSTSEEQRKISEARGKTKQLNIFRQLQSRGKGHPSVAEKEIKGNALEKQGKADFIEKKTKRSDGHKKKQRLSILTCLRPEIAGHSSMTQGYRGDNPAHGQEKAEPIVTLTSKEEHKRGEGREKKRQLVIFKRLRSNRIGHSSMVEDEGGETSGTGQEKETHVEARAEEAQSWCQGKKPNLSLGKEKSKKHTSNVTEIPRTPREAVTVAADAPMAAGPTVAAKQDPILPREPGKPGSPSVPGAPLNPERPKKKTAKTKHQVSKEEPLLYDAGISAHVSESDSDDDTDYISRMDTNNSLVKRTCYQEEMESYSQVRNENIAVQKNLLNAEQLVSKLQNRMMELQKSELEMKSALRNVVEEIIPTGCKTPEKLRKKEEQLYEFIELKELELHTKTLERELEGTSNQFKNQHEFMRPTSLEEKEKISRPYDSNLNSNGLKSFLHKMMTKVADIKAEHETTYEEFLEIRHVNMEKITYDPEIDTVKTSKKRTPESREGVERRPGILYENLARGENLNDDTGYMIERFVQIKTALDKNFKKIGDFEKEITRFKEILNMINSGPEVGQCSKYQAEEKQEVTSKKRPKKH